MNKTDDREGQEPEPDDENRVGDRDLEREIAAGEWQRLKEFTSYRKRTRQGKILALYQAISNRLNQLTLIFAQLVRNDPSGAEKLLEEIKKLRRMQDFLSQCLIWEKKGEEIMLPDEVADIIE